MNDLDLIAELLDPTVHTAEAERLVAPAADRDDEPAPTLFPLYGYGRGRTPVDTGRREVAVS